MTEEIIFINGEYFVSPEFLKNNGISESTIYNGTHRNYSGKSRDWQFIGDYKDKRRIFINYSTISKNTKSKLPKLSEVEFIYKSKKENEEINKIEEKQRILFFSLENAINHKWTKYAPFYQKYFNDYDKIQLYSKTHVAFLELIEFRKSKYKIKDLFSIYRKFKDLVFATESPTYFYKKFKIASYTNIEKILIHNSTGKESHNKKTREEHLAFLRDRSRKPEQFTSRISYLELKKYCIKNGLSVISYSKVRQITSDPEFINSCILFRRGLIAAEQELLPYLPRKKPTNPGDLWELDGYKIQLPYKDHNGKPVFVCMFVFLDAHSGKIIGYSIDKSENSVMIINAFKIACKNTGYLPCEILHDNFSAFNQADFKELQKNCELIGVNFRRARVGNAKDKSHVERFFSTFQTTVLKKEVGYIGEGIKSKRKDARPAPELLQSNLYTKSLKTIFEYEDFIDGLLNEYNSNKIENEPSPNTKYDYTAPNKVYVLSEPQFAYLFYKKTEIVMSRSMIVLGSNKLIYQFGDNNKENIDLKLKLNKTRVEVAYDPENIEKIYLFDEKTKKYQTTLVLPDPVPIIKREQTIEHRKKIIQHNENNKEFINNLIHRAIQDRELINDDEDNESLNLMINTFKTKEKLIKAEEQLDLKEISPDNQEKKEKKKAKQSKSINKKEKLGSYYAEGSLKVISVKYG